MLIFILHHFSPPDPVPTPNVTKLNSSSESCSLLCWVDRETTLLWFKDEQMLNQSSSALSLPLTVHKQDFSSSYRCVAANPAEEKTLPVRVRTTCGDTDDNDTNSSNKPRNCEIISNCDFKHVVHCVCWHLISCLTDNILIIICVLLVVMIILATFIIKSKYLSRNKTKTNGQAQGRYLFSLFILFIVFTSNLFGACRSKPSDPDDIRQKHIWVHSAVTRLCLTVVWLTSVESLSC